MNSKLTYDHKYFDALYRVNQGDPWQYEQRWYEQRKRQICLALLPRPHFESAIEIGCSNGVFSQALAERTNGLICLDAHSTAVRLARQRLQGYAHVNVRQGIVPADLPEGKFQLIVLSEILYYLDHATLEQLIHWLLKALDHGGCILACHWRAPISGFALTGDDVHHYLQRHLPYQKCSQLQEPDFQVEVWINSAQSLAEQEGLK
jgi:SAM-dependent methyltransferase